MERVYSSTQSLLNDQSESSACGELWIFMIKAERRKIV